MHETEHETGPSYPGARLRFLFPEFFLSFFLTFFFLHLVNVFLGGNVIEWTDTLQGLSAHKISERGDWNVGPDPEDRSTALICSKEERVV